MNTIDMKSLILLLLFAKGLLLQSQPCHTDSIVHRQVRAIETDSKIDWELNQHQVLYNPTCSQNGKLLLHLVGSFDNPANTFYYPVLAANNGFKVINLKYKNETPALTACGNSSLEDCFTNFREEIVFGNDVSAEVDVDLPNCILFRFLKVLLYLDDNYPTENWGDFLKDADEVDFSNIILSGHSQGGGHAAYLAKHVAVNRVLMFASPNDYSTNFSAPADWVSRSGATATSDYFAFGNVLDNISDFNNQYKIWSDMGILNSIDSIRVDNTTCNYNNTNVLYTSNNYSVTHNNMIIDNFTPLSGGTPTFAPVWEYMLGVCDKTNTVLQSNEILNTISVFPNPSSSQVKIKSKGKISKIEVYSLTGTLLKTVKPLQSNYELNIDTYKGLLFLNITINASEMKTYKLLVH